MKSLEIGVCVLSNLVIDTTVNCFSDVFLRGRFDLFMGIGKMIVTGVGLKKGE